MAHSAGPTEPLFSVVMPVHNHVEFVAEAVRSVLAQSWPGWELIVVDDGSTDGSGEVAARTAGGDPRVRLLRQENRGPAAARNRAVAEGRGRWIAFLDSDDLWFPETLSSYAECIRVQPSERFLHGFRHRLNLDGTVTELRARHQDRPTGVAELFADMHLSHLSVTLRRDLLESAGGYDEGLRNGEDYDLFLRLGLRTRFWPLGKATGLRRRHAGNISRASGARRLEQAEVLERFAPRLAGGHLIPEKLVRLRLGRAFLSAGRLFLRELRFREARAALQKAASYRRTPAALGCLLVSRIFAPWPLRAL